MTNIDLSALGLTPEILREQIITRAVDRIVTISLNGPGDDLDEDNEYAAVDLPNVATLVQKQVAAHVEKITSRIGDEIVAPKVESLIETLTFTKTSQWGEPKAEPKTWREMLVEKAEGYLSEPVNYDGETKSQGSHNWRHHTTRVAHLVEKHIQYEIDKAIKAALADANSKIAGGILGAVRLSLQEALGKLSVTTKVS
jgi:hypothetical protein